MKNIVEWLADKAGLLQQAEVYVLLETLMVDYETVEGGKQYNDVVFVDIGSARKYALGIHPHGEKISWNEDHKHMPGQFGFFRVEDEMGIVQWEYLIKATPLFGQSKVKEGSK